ALPFLFMVVMTFWASFENQWHFYQQGLWLLFGINFVIIVAVMIMVVFVVMECIQFRNSEPQFKISNSSLR
ncbi:MAG: hypothetical protein VW397_06705, partial [Candidatus Margulisiibacteriota bacterium]